MKKTILLLTTIFTLILASNSFAWTLVYSNDSSGNATYGNIQTLIDAANNGKSIRFLLEAPYSNNIYHAAVVWVKNNIVYAQNNTSVSATWDGDILDFFSNPYRLFLIADTNGIVNSSRWAISDNSAIGTTRNNYPVKWFVQ